MKPYDSFSRREAFSLIELFAVAGVFAVLAMILLPGLKAHTCGCRINCVNNLRQIGLAYNCWALDYGGRYPMAVSTNEGGTKELETTSNAFMSFRVMSNELSTPKLLVCPTDTQRHWATNFGLDFANARISYFVGLDATPTNLTLLLSGDRNLTNTLRLSEGILELRPGDGAGWTPDLHRLAGNVLIADGSVQQLTPFGLRTTLAQCTTTNRLAMP